MNSNILNSILVSLTLLVFSCQQKSGEKVAETPNIIYILADDLGYGDVAAFNENCKIKTPHLDLLASEGMKFTDAHTSS